MTLPKWASRGPSDRLTEECANLISERTATRERLFGGLFQGCAGEGIAKLEKAFGAVIDCAPVEKRLRDAELSQQQALKAGKITEAENDSLNAMNAAVQAVIAVDDFSPSELAKFFPGLKAGRKAVKPRRSQKPTKEAAE